MNKQNEYPVIMRFEVSEEFGLRIAEAARYAGMSPDEFITDIFRDFIKERKEMRNNGKEMRNNGKERRNNGKERTTTTKRQDSEDEVSNVSFYWVGMV